MTWKTYAAVSGATVLAGWLASSPPSNAPAPAAAPQRRAAAQAPAPEAGADIAEQAARLQARVREDAVYREPARNPFRFGAREVAPKGSAAGRAVAEPPPIDEVAPAPLPPPVRLSGIAEDRSGDRTERTAVLSSASGVLLVHEGDDVLGQYRVARIDADAVELTSVSGGPSLRLTLTP